METSLMTRPRKTQGTEELLGQKESLFDLLGYPVSRILKYKKEKRQSPSPIWLPEFHASTSFEFDGAFIAVIPSSTTA